MTNYINKARQGRVKALAFLQQKQLGTAEGYASQSHFGTPEMIRRSELNLWAPEFGGRART